MRPERIFRCGYCGGWRYTLARPCHTCRLLENRHALGLFDNRQTSQREENHS